jgi:hypothetical protein
VLIKNFKIYKIEGLLKIGVGALFEYVGLSLIGVALLGLILKDLLNYREKDNAYSFFLLFILTTYFLLGAVLNGITPRYTLIYAPFVVIYLGNAVFKNLRKEHLFLIFIALLSGYFVNQGLDGYYTSVREGRYSAYVFLQSLSTEKIGYASKSFFLSYYLWDDLIKVPFKPDSKEFESFICVNNVSHVLMVGEVTESIPSLKLIRDYGSERRSIIIPESIPGIPYILYFPSKVTPEKISILEFNGSCGERRK